MKVLIFIAYPRLMAGANRSLLDLLSGLRKRCDILVVSTGEGPVVDVYREKGFRIEVVPPAPVLTTYGKALAKGSALRKLGLALAVLRYTLKLLPLLRRERIDIVHVNDMRGGLLAGLAARLSGLPLVGHVRGEHGVERAYGLAYEWLCHRLITVSDKIRHSLGARGQAKAVTIYNGIDDSVFGAPERKLGWIERERAAGRLVFSYFAVLVPFKGHSVLLEAMARLNAQGFGDRYVVLCMGELLAEYADYQKLLFERQAELGVGNVTFAGWQRNPFDFYTQADVCLMVSSNSGSIELGGQRIALYGNEGFPRTILEAMMFAKPVIGADNAGICEQVVDGVTGRLIPPLDAEALAQAMREMIEHRERLPEMGEAAARRVREKFSSQRCQDGVHAIYRELLGA